MLTDEEIHGLYVKYNSYPMSYDDMDTAPDFMEDILTISSSEKQRIRERSWYEDVYIPRYSH